MPSIISTIIQYAVLLVVAYVLVLGPLLTSILPQSWLGYSTAHVVLSNTSSHSSLFLPSQNQSCPNHEYKTTILSRSPLIIYIHSFLSQSERNQLLTLSHKQWNPSPIYAGGSEATIDQTIRNSSRAPLPSNDPTVSCLAKRALDFQGWPRDTFVEQMWTQRYLPGGHYGYHFDWAGDLRRRKAGRVSTFMVYVGCEDCVGGGTKFPRLPVLTDDVFCDVVDCDSEARDVEGVTFKPIPGNAIYWENFKPDGRGWEELWHAALPVENGVKVGLNIWSWFQDGYGAVYEEQQMKNVQQEQYEEKSEL